MSYARDVLDILGLDYSEAGERIMLVCPLPDHADTGPSMAVWQEQGRYHCFGCETQGDVTDLYTRVRGLTRNLAEAEIAKYLGTPPPMAKRADPQVAAHARGRLENRLVELRPYCQPAEHAAHAERADKILWCFEKGLIDSGQLGGAIERFLGET